MKPDHNTGKKHEVDKLNSKFSREKSKVEDDTEVEPLEYSGDILEEDSEESGDILEEELEEFDDEMENDLELEYMDDHEDNIQDDLYLDDNKVSYNSSVNANGEDNIPDEQELEEEYREELEELDEEDEEEFEDEIRDSFVENNRMQKNHKKQIDVPNVRVNANRRKRNQETAITREGRSGSRNNKYRKKINNKKRQQRRVTLVALLAVAVLVLVLSCAYLIDRITPTKDMYNSNTYFDVNSDDSGVLVMVDGEIYPDQGVYVDGELYLSQTFVTDNINIRFYYNQESDSILYTDSETVYEFMENNTTFSDLQGKSYELQSPVFKKVNGQNCLNFTFVAERTNIIYEYASNPDRLIIRLAGVQETYVTVKKKTEVRYRAGIKSKILEKEDKGVCLYYVDTVDNWTKVITSSGFTGYIKTSCLEDPVTEVSQNTFTENRTTIQKNYKINMTWYQVTNKTGNNFVGQSLANTSGVTTISPTWYSISDQSGSVSSIASDEFVSSMHARGIEVWPLIDDFNKDLDYSALYASRTARTKIISKLMSEASIFEFDGINVDFENIKKDYAQDYLQFIRELSVECQKNGLVLSIDNYKPEVYNSFYNIKEQASFADYVIIMGYDEHYSDSEAGSVASLPFVKEGIEDALAVVPKGQLINAIPFYTRIWTVTDTGTTSKAVGMQAAIDDISSSGVPALWDDSVGQYFGSYESNGAMVKIWFEEEKSVEEKMKLIQENDLAGVASWKLGMEKPTVWNVINNYLR